MDEIPSYNLLQAIDPTKIKVPISERFAKLTLSSNKKQQQKCTAPEPLNRQQLEKRDSVTRNICKQFDNVNQENEEQKKIENNPLLRSESSKETECNNLVDEEPDLEMEPLEVSADEYNPSQAQTENDLELLSQQMASMCVQPNLISLSSGSTADLSVFSDMISSESQRSSANEVDNIHIVHNVPINVREAAKRNTMHLNLTSSTQDSLEKTYEMTENEEEEESYDEDDEPITISDTSSTHREEEHIMTTSSLPSTTVTSENLSLPSLVDDKAERVAAFLRDVSKEQQAMKEQGQLIFHDTVDEMLDNDEIDKIQHTLVKSRKIATADTESMTPDEGEEVIPPSLPEREKRLKMLEKSAEEEQLENLEICTSIEDQLCTPKSRNSTRNAQRLANDETLDNTVMTEMDNEMEETPKIESRLKYPPKNSYKISYYETQCSMNVETPKAAQTKNQNEENSRRLADLETEDNTESSLNPKQQTDPCRLVNDDTVANSMITDFEGALLQHTDHNYSQDDQEKTCAKNSKTITNDETTNENLMSIHSTSESSIYSIASALNSSNEFNVTVPEHSVTILETDEEENENVEAKSFEKGANSVENKLSNSFHKEDSSDDSSEYDGQMSQIQMSMGKINISAKINIKISIPNIISAESSEDDQNYGREDTDNERKSKASSQLADMQDESNEQDQEEEAIDNNHSVDSSEKSVESDSPQRPCNQMQLKAPIEQIVPSPNKSSDSVEAEEDEKFQTETEKSMESDSPPRPCNPMAQNAAIEDIGSSPNKSSDSTEAEEDEKFLTEAEKLLTQLYGKSWQTPDVIRTLKRSSQSGDKKANKSKSFSSKKIDVKSSTEKKCLNKSKVEETLLDDFSMFRRNIVKTNLDSTRFVSPKSVVHRKEVFTEPKIRRKPATTQKGKIDAKPLPQTERKPPMVTTSKGRVIKEKWRQLIDDSNSEGDNASDDEDADKSWSEIASELEVNSSDSDFEISPINTGRRGKRKISKRSGRSEKSDYLTKVLNKSKEGEIVYLDLSKEEVEVQNEVPESPPANRDVTFATRLQDILISCQHEEKAKLPSTTRKTKRKLFTPNFGEENLEIAYPSEDEKKARENDTRTKKLLYNDDEILEDKGICPFDSQGRPKIFDVVNKQLESVKRGKPIFQLTPPLRKQFNTPNSIKKSDKNAKDDAETTPKAKTVSEGIFKTPLSVKSKGATKSIKDILRTPDYKYSFLKSLDVTVSKTLCHPDALYYRDNYRIRKEELSKILYDMYNEKLFQNQLDVPIKWNKKLLNTAGRCLNKKKSGIRSSIVELSDKVLTSADRLRCTLIHELCHAATWIVNGEGGHGSSWKEWARRANNVFPEIPKIGVCHQYDIEYKYTYKCTLCAAKSHAHSKSKKVENIRCSYCHGAIEIYLNKKDKDGNVMATPVREPTGFAKFVQENYKKFKRSDLKHADVMKLLSSEFASLKVAGN